MRLSKNFTLRELTRSQTAARRGIDNTPPRWAVENLERLAQGVLQPVRDHFGPTNVSSGFRCDELERAIKGKPDDWTPRGQHPQGEAADFETVRHSNVEVVAWIAENLTFDQLILEFYDGVDPHSGWIHCSFVRPPRGNVLRAVTRGRNVTYLPGLED